MKCDIPVGTTVPEYGLRINRPKRHSAISRFAGYGLLR
jgi:hypothetical protein